MLVNLLPVSAIRPLPSAFCASRKSGRSCKPQRKRQRKRSGRGQKGAFVCDETPHYATQYTPGSISANVGRAQSRGRTRPHRGAVTLLTVSRVSLQEEAAQAAAVAVCHTLIASFRNWRSVFREIRWRCTLKLL